MKKAKPCLFIDGRYFPTMRKASYALKLSIGGLSRRLKHKQYPFSNKMPRHKTGNSYVKPVRINAKEFNSVFEASRHFDVSEITIINWCKGRSHLMPNCQYIN